MKKHVDIAKINETLAAHHIQKPSEIFLDALMDDSNREIEWLWTANHVHTDAERAYCFERALYINPRNNRVYLALTELRKRMSQPRKTAHPNPEMATFLARWVSLNGA